MRREDQGCCFPSDWLAASMSSVLCSLAKYEMLPKHPKARTQSLPWTTALVNREGRRSGYSYVYLSTQCAKGDCDNIAHFERTIVHAVSIGLGMGRSCYRSFGQEEARHDRLSPRCKAVSCPNSEIFLRLSTVSASVGLTLS